MILYWVVIFSYIEWPLYLFSFMFGPQTFWKPLVKHAVSFIIWWNNSRSCKWSQCVMCGYAVVCCGPIIGYAVVCVVGPLSGMLLCVLWAHYRLCCCGPIIGMLLCVLWAHYRVCCCWPIIGYAVVGPLSGVLLCVKFRWTRNY